MKTLINNPQFKAFASSIDYGIMVGSTDGLILDFNEAALDMFGYTAEELRDKPITVIMPSRFRKAHTAGMARYNHTHQPVVLGKTMRVHGLHKDGHEFPMEIALSSWKNSSGEEFFTASLRRYSALENNLSWILASSAIATVSLIGIMVYLGLRF